MPRQVGEEERAEARGMLEAVGAAGQYRRLHPAPVLHQRAEEERLGVRPLRVGRPERRSLDPSPAGHLRAAAELDLAGTLRAEDKPRHRGDFERTFQKIASRPDHDLARRGRILRRRRERLLKLVRRVYGHRPGRGRRSRRQHSAGKHRFHAYVIFHWCELYHIQPSACDGRPTSRHARADFDIIPAT